MRHKATPTERFLAKAVHQPDGCWQWQGFVSPTGYGTFSVKENPQSRRKNVLAHRFSYQTFVGDIPEGLVIDHLCRNRACVNPAHLEAVTMRENLLRGETHAAINASKRECPRGHPFDEANTYVSKPGRRHCRACHRDREIERRSRIRISTEGALPC